ncbi:hypothetical protein HanIR_Chr00c08g0906601 [Helianthus annuus]|nr:hypothetical protein HanIR_Chr00c08g0906601 [Helianthus annuus]
MLILTVVSEQYYGFFIWLIENFVRFLKFLVYVGCRQGGGDSWSNQTEYVFYRLWMIG